MPLFKIIYLLYFWLHWIIFAFSSCSVGATLFFELKKNIIILTPKTFSAGV